MFSNSLFFHLFSYHSLNFKNIKEPKSSSFMPKFIIKMFDSFIHFLDLD